MGHHFEAGADSSVRNLGKDEKKEKPKPTASTHSKEGSDDNEDRRENEVFEFVKLLENSGSSEAMKALLLKILNSNKTDELMPFLKDRSTDTNRLKKKLGKAILETNSGDDRSKKQKVRRSSKIGRPELSEQCNGSGHGLKNGMRKSARTRTIEQGGRTNATGALTKINNVQHSPGSSLRRSRQSDICLRKSHRDGVLESHNQKSRLASSSSLLQLRTTRRGDLNRRRAVGSSNPGEMQAVKQNAGWDFPPGGLTIGKRRTSTGSFLKAAPMSPGNQNASNASWDSAYSPTKGVAGVDKLRHKGLGKISEKRIDLGNKKKNLSDYSGGDEDRSTTEINDIKPQNTFAQFEPTGQVAYREQTVRLHDLVDDLRLNRESNRDSISSNKEAIDETMPGKKGLRKYLARQLTTTKKVISREKQSIASESSNENYRSLSDGNKFHVNDQNNSIESFSLQSSIAS